MKLIGRQNKSLRRDIQLHPQTVEKPMADPSRLEQAQAENRLLRQSSQFPLFKAICGFPPPWRGHSRIDKRGSTRH